MRGIALDEFGGPEVLTLRDDLPIPPVGPDTVLVRIRAASVSPIDVQIRRGLLADVIPTWSPVVPGWDGAGVVEAVGEAVTAFRPGDEVYGCFRRDFIRDGTHAELAAIRDTQLMRKPDVLSFEEAGATPVAALTAWQLVDEALRIARGELVLICGAADATGSFAVQLAKRAGATVIALDSARNHDHLRRLGADECLDADGEDFVDVLARRYLAGPDGVIDLVGGATLRRCGEIVRPRGRVASTVQPPPTDGLFAEHEIQGRFVFPRPDPANLRHLTRVLESGELQVTLSDVLGLEQAARGHELVELGHTRGQLALRI